MDCWMENKYEIHCLSVQQNQTVNAADELAVAMREMNSLAPIS